MFNPRFLPIVALCIMSTIEICAAADERDPRFPEDFQFAVCTNECSPVKHRQIAPQNLPIFKEIQRNDELKAKFTRCSSDVLYCACEQLNAHGINFVAEERKAFDQEPVSCFSGTPFALHTIRKNIPWLCSALCLFTGTVSACSGTPCCCTACAGAAAVPHLLHAMKKRSLPDGLRELAWVAAKEKLQRDDFVFELLKRRNDVVLYRDMLSASIRIMSRYPATLYPAR